MPNCEINKVEVLHLTETKLSSKIRKYKLSIRPVFRFLFKAFPFLEIMQCGPYILFCQSIWNASQSALHIINWQGEWQGLVKITTTFHRNIRLSFLDVIDWFLFILLTFYGELGTSCINSKFVNRNIFYKEFPCYNRIQCQNLLNNFILVYKNSF